MSDSGLRDLLALTPEDELPYDENSAAVQALDLAADSLRQIRKEALERVTLDSKARSGAVCVRSQLFFSCGEGTPHWCWGFVSPRGSLSVLSVPNHPCQRTSNGPQVVDLLADLREFAQEKCEPPIYVSGARPVVTAHTGRFPARWISRRIA